jgi:M6 family metalloprotease-like protein
MEAHLHARSSQLFAATLALIALARPALGVVPTPAGMLSPEVVQASAAGLFALPPRPAGTISVAQNTWRIPVIEISFTDDTLVYNSQSMNTVLFDTTHVTPHGSVYDYYRWVSNGRLTIIGNVVARVMLPHDHYYYGYGSNGLYTTSPVNNMLGALRDALKQCQSTVTWSDYDLDRDGYVDMLWMVHAGTGGEAGRDRSDFWSITTRMSGPWNGGAAYETWEHVPGSTTQYMRIDRFSTMPEQSSFVPPQMTEIGVFCHEFGHALGLPDLYDTSSLGGASNMGPGNWALMSSGAYGVNGSTPSEPSHLGAWSLTFLGWATTTTPADDQTMVLPPIERSSQVVNFWFQGEPSPEHFLIENRQRLDFDEFLPSPGLIVTHVDESVIGALLGSNRINAGFTPGLRIVEADGRGDLVSGADRGDPSDPYPGSTHAAKLDDDTPGNTRTFAGAVTNIGLSNFTPSGTDMSVHVQVRARGWSAIEDHTAGAFAPLAPSSGATTAVCDTFGTIDAVASEMRSGVPQVVLRERAALNWATPLTLSSSSLGAYEPTLAAQQNGDLSVVWRDMRSGIARLYSRSRIRGQWTPEQPVGNVPSNSSVPALATDGHGRLMLTWLTVILGRPRVEFMTYTYLSPFGSPVSLADSSAYPDSPIIAASPAGRAYVIWMDRSQAPQTLYFTRYDPDSGLAAPLMLGPPGASDMMSPSAGVDMYGRLNVLWESIGTGVASVHYQCRDFAQSYWQRDTVIDQPTGGVLGPVMSVDRAGGVHVAYETTRGSVQEICYKHAEDGRGWDASATEVTRAGDGNSHQPQIVATGPHDVTVMFSSYPAGQPRLMTRDRHLDGIRVSAVGSTPAPLASGLQLGPNPLHGGAALELRLDGALPAGPARVDFYDVAGRRVATVALAGSGLEHFARLSGASTATWPAGLYFARLRDSAATARLVLLH